MGRQRTHRVLGLLPALLLASPHAGCGDSDGGFGLSDDESAGRAGATVLDSRARPAQSEDDELAPSNEGDRYEDVGTNPFVMVAHDPFSTFAADVDTASYDIFRRDLGYGIRPVPQSVRLEEFVNYFDYDYPAPGPDDEHPFEVTVDAAPSLFDAPTTLLRIGIQAVKPPPLEKKPTNLVFLIDTSGSMQSDDKLPLVQKLLTSALGVLEGDDTVSIVTYAGSTGVALPPTAASERTRIADVINSFGAGGSTAGAAGIELAYAQASDGFIEGGINHVVLCTDGDFNVGPSSSEELVALIERKRETGITLTALGFGIGNLNDAMMERVSNAGNGIYSVITSETHAARYAESDLLASLVHVARDMKIQVEFNAEQVSAYRLLGYENRAIADDDFRDDAVDAGEVGAGHQVTALYELVLADASIPAPAGAPSPTDGEPVDGEREVSTDDLVLVKVRYKDVDADALGPAREVSYSLASDAVAASYREMDGDFQWAIAVAAFAELLKRSPYANAALLDTLEGIFSAQAGDDPDRRELVLLASQARPLL